MTKLSIDLSKLLDSPPQYIPTTACVTGTAQARQRETKVEPEDELVLSIKQMKGLIHPIIVKKYQEENQTKYEIIVGQRRWHAHEILEMDVIKAFVIDRDLSDDEKKVISFAENVGTKKMLRRDYVDVIDYFYTRYGANRQALKDAAEELGLKKAVAQEYLTEARLPEEIKKITDEFKEGQRDEDHFSVDSAIKALKALGDDEESANIEDWISTAKEISSLQGGYRGPGTALMRKNPGMTFEKTKKREKERKEKKENEIRIEATPDRLEKLETMIEDEGLDDIPSAASVAFDRGLKASK